MTTNKKGAPTAPQSTTVNPNKKQSNTTDFITILTTLGPVLTKVFRADGTTKNYGNAKNFKSREIEVSNIKDLAAKLVVLEGKSKSAIIRGKLSATPERGENPGTVLRTNVSFNDCPHHWLMIDIDKYKPGFADPLKNTADAVRDFLEDAGLHQFKDCSFHWQLSSSAGTPGKEEILKCHAWFWSETAYTSAQMYAWAQRVGILVDKAVYRRVQLHYTASPVFEEGAEDPVAVRSGFYQGARDTVPLTMDSALLESARITAGGKDTKLVDPSEKEGLIGDFHRAFEVETVLMEHLEGMFEPGSNARRWTWLDGGGTPEGVWVHDDGMHVHATHNTWPIEGICNLWDLVRVFKFGELDKADDDFDQRDLKNTPIQGRPSHQAMIEWARTLPDVVEEIAKTEQKRHDVVANLLADIKSASTSEVNGPLVDKIRALKSEGADAAVAATLDKAIQQRLKRLSPNQAAPSIDDVRRMTKPVPKARKNNLLDRDDQLGCARALAAVEFKDQNHLLLGVRNAEEWYQFDGRCFIEITEEAIRCITWKFLGKSLTLGGGELPNPEPFKPSQKDVSGVADALKSVLNIGEIQPPAWIPGGEGPDPRNLIVMKNGILNAETGELIEHTPRLFSTNALPFDFDPATQCPMFLNFLNQLWPDDQESQELLQEWFGYCLTADTRQQKFLMCVGPRRSGKGTIARVLGELLGDTNTIGPTLASMCDKHGLQQWLGKLVAIIGDARGGGKEPQVVLERILNIVGEDKITVPRMYRSAVSVRLPTRVMIMSNELLRLGDSSNALVGRMLVLKMTQSFLGAEDINLADRLLGELPGILNWALCGRRRLIQRGRFAQPSSSQGLLKEIQEANDPVGAFVDEYCEVAPSYETSQAIIFQGWQAFCHGQNRHPGTLTVFSKDLAASKGFELHRPRIDGKQVRTYKGVRLRQSVIDQLNLSAFESMRAA